MANKGGLGRIQGLTKISPKHRKVVNNYLISGNATKAYKKEYPNANLNTASNEGNKIIKSMGITMEKLMEAKGLSKGKLIDKVSQKMNSKKPFSSPTEPDRMVDDNPSQLKAVEIAGKWLGVDKGTQVNVQVNVPILGGKSNLEDIEE